MAGVEHQQYDMFKQTLVDNRTRSQKQADKARGTTQNLMFSQRDMAQFGVNPNPLFPLSPKMLLPMMSEDPRTEDEIEADRMREAQRLMTPMFPVDEETTSIPEPVTTAIPSKPLPFVQPVVISERRRPMPPAPPGQFAVQHRFAPSPDVPKREKVVWRPSSKPAIRTIGLAEVGDPDPTKNEANCHVAKVMEAFEGGIGDHALITTSYLFNLLLATIEARSSGMTETELTPAHFTGQATTETHTARKDI